MKIKLTPNYTYLIPQNKNDLEEIEFAREKYIVRKMEFDPILKKKRAIYLPIINHKNAFLTGLLPIIKIPSLKKIQPYPQYHLEKLKNKQEIEKDKLYQRLRDYQKEALWKLIERPRAILEAPTGSGKTEIMKALVSAFRKDNKILICIPKTTTLLEQTVKRFLEHFNQNEIGYLYGKGSKHGRILFVSPAKLKDLIEYNMIDWDIFICDEVHTVASNQIKNFLLKTKIPIRYGFSATPIGRSDENDYITLGLIGDIIKVVNMKDLINQGYLSQIEYHFILFSSFGINSRIFSLNNWHKIMNEIVIPSQLRRDIIKYLIKKIKEKNQNCLIIVERKEYGKILLEELRQIVDNIEFIYSGLSQAKINHCIEKFKEGKLKVLIATQLIETGIDIPNIENIILAQVGKSRIQILQRIGRGLRPYPGKKLLVFDLVDCSNGILIGHYKQRKKEIEKNKINHYVWKLDNFEDLDKIRI